MKKYFGFTTQTVAELIRGYLKVYADEPTPAEPTPAEPTPAEPQKTPINYEDLISKARKEEKDKLYPQIESLKTQINSWTEKANTHLITIAEKDSEIAELKKQVETLKNSKGDKDSELVTQLKKEIKDLKKAIETEQANKVDPTEIENRIRGEYEVKLYREQKLREAGEDIIPELVFGTTQEEIDASIENSKNRFKEITGKVVKTTTHKTPITNPATVLDKDFDINSVQTATHEDWKEIRKKLGLK